MFRHHKMRFITATMDLNQSEIVKFYKNQTIFITGGTGFLGKVLIEKLLRVCDVKRIYVLVRPKKGKSTQERFNNLFDFPCFDRLKSEKDDFWNKITLIDGDCVKLNLGLTPEDQEILKKETTCFIHAAANVKFDQNLRTAASNARSVRDALNLAKQMAQLKAFVFVSTAYSNCIYPYIGEKFYDPPMTADELFTLVEETSDEMLEKITPRLLGQYPNTYIYTKCIAENVVKEESKNLPVTIVRPAMVTSTMEEPMAGWIDNFYGIIGISVAAGLGVLRSLHINLDGVANIVPCDYVSNLVLTSSWYIHDQMLKNKNRNSVPIFNYTGKKKNPLTWRRYKAYIEELAWDLCSEKIVWYYCFQLRENYYWHNICVFFQHTVFSYVADFFLIIAGRTPLAVKNYARLDKMISYITYFTLNSWFFDSRNVEYLWNKLGDTDRKLFNFDMESVVFYEYILSSIRGSRIYLLKDPMETIPKGNRKMWMLFVLHYSLLILLAIFIIWLGSFLFKMLFGNM